MTSDIENHFTDNDILSDSIGFNIAFGLSYFDGSPNFIEDPDYGVLKAKYRQWGFTDVDAVGVKEFPTKRCNASDFYFDEEMEYIGEERKVKLTQEEIDSEKPFFFPPNEF